MALSFTECLANSPAGETGSQSFLFDAVTLIANANKLKPIIFNIFHMVVKLTSSNFNINLQNTNGGHYISVSGLLV